MLRPNVERQWISPAGELICGVDKEIQTIRAGSKFYTLLALGSGMNATMNSWGEALAAVAEKKPLPADADVVLRKIGYWTDNGGAYYYRSDPGKSYTETFLALQDEFTSKGARLGYVQLDSWHYPKGAREIGQTTPVVSGSIALLPNCSPEDSRIYTNACNYP